MRSMLNGITNRTAAYDAFVAKVDTFSSGSNSLLYSTFLGGSNNDAGFRITLDANNNAYITGNSTSPDFPFTNFPNLKGIRTNLLFSDAFLTKMSFGNGGAD